jgi:hypothetical protein
MRQIIADLSKQLSAASALSAGKPKLGLEPGGFHHRHLTRRSLFSKPMSIPL